VQVVFELDLLWVGSTAPLLWDGSRKGRSEPDVPETQYPACPSTLNLLYVILA
jgi:hypothetical protein